MPSEGPHALASYGREYKAARARSIAYGRWQPYMDAGPVRGHVAALAARGMSYNQIAAAAGVSRDCVRSLVVGRPHKGLPPTPRLLTAKGQAILAVQFDLDAMSDRALIDAAGTRRRAQALAAMGHSIRWQARQLGRTVNNYHDVVSADLVHVSTARQVRDLYDQWSMTPPELTPAVKTAKTFAAKNGWLPPLAWDDDLIDIPDALLQRELDRRAAEMTSAELHRCDAAFRKHGDRSPLVLAACKELARRRYQQRRTS